MGIYEELVNAIRSFNWDALKRVLAFRPREALENIPWQFLLVLGAGIVTAFITLARPISWLLDHQPVFLYAFFFGLILASITAVSRQISWSPMAFACLILGTAVAYYVVGLVPSATPQTVLVLFFSGMAAITAMILPGISGSFILLILGQYEFVIDSIKDGAVLSLVPLALGCIVGILGFVRILSWLLRNYHHWTIAVLIGFMVGSLRKIWPFKVTVEQVLGHNNQLVPLRQANVLPDIDSTFWVALGLTVIGFILVSVIDRIAGSSRVETAADELGG
jgi:putative membrane protein